MSDLFPDYKGWVCYEASAEMLYEGYCITKTKWINPKTPVRLYLDCKEPPEIAMQSIKELIDKLEQTNANQPPE